MSRPRKESRQREVFTQARFAAAATLGALLMLTVPAAAQKVQVSGPSRGFSFVPPAGWQVTTRAVPYRLLCIVQSPHEDAATVSVQETMSGLPVDRYVQTLLKTLMGTAPQTRLLSRGPFVTSSGLHGYRVAFDRTTPGQSVHFVLYAFPGAGRHKFLCAGLWPAAGIARDTAATDAAMKTFIVKAQD